LLGQDAAARISHVELDVRGGAVVCQRENAALRHSIKGVLNAVISCTIMDAPMS